MSMKTGHKLVVCGLIAGVSGTALLGYAMLMLNSLEVEQVELWGNIVELGLFLLVAMFVSIGLGGLYEATRS